MARLVAAIILALGFAHCSVAHEALLACDSSSFPVNLTGTQINGLHRKTAANADACRQACCDEGSSCHVWQWAQGHTCWIGKYGPSGGAGDYVSFGRDIPKPTPPPTPSSFAEIKKVFIVFSNHLDVGYTLNDNGSCAAAVLNQYWEEHFPLAIKTANEFRANTSSSDQYRWMTHSWLGEGTCCCD